MTPYRPSSFRSWHTALWLGLWVLAGHATAQDAPYDDIQRLVNAGQFEQALARTDAWLDQHPKDPQARFLKGVTQSRQGLNDAATATFTELTRDYPELPEPHNNLAVLHANAGRLGQARAALESATQLNPAYATAHQNLGDVYLQLAIQHYRTSLKLSPTATAHSRLQALETLTTPPAPAIPAAR